MMRMLLRPDRLTLACLHDHPWILLRVALIRDDLDDTVTSFSFETFALK